MIGYPNTLNTKEDYIYVKDNFPREQWIKDWQILLDSVNDWFFDHVLEDGEIGINDDTHKVVIEEVNTENDNIRKNVQYVLKQNDTCKLLNIGFTIEEVQAVIAE